MVFFAPWRKIRRWSQVQGNSVHFEVFFTDEMRFEWVEVESKQAAYLMAVIAEFVFIIKRDSEEPTFKTPKWIQNKMANKITWKVIKKELFSSKKKEKPEGEEDQQEGEDEEENEESEEESSDDEEAEFVHRLDSIYDEGSSGEEDEGVAARASGSKTKTRYKPI